MTFEEKENAYTSLIERAADSEGKLFIEDSGEGRDKETEDMYLEDVSGWLAPKTIPEEHRRDDEYYCFAEWEIVDGKPVVHFRHYNCEDRITDFKLFDRVKLKATGEIAFIVWYNEDYPKVDSFLLEIKGKNELPKFYKRADFEVIGDQ